MTGIHLPLINNSHSIFRRHSLPFNELRSTPTVQFDPEKYNIMCSYILLQLLIILFVWSTVNSTVKHLAEHANDQGIFVVHEGPRGGPNRAPVFPKLMDKVKIIIQVSCVFQATRHRTRRMSMLFNDNNNNNK